MNSSTRRFALRAAAKVALSATLAACGGATESESSEGSGQGATLDAVASCGATSAGADADVSSATFDCCATYLTAQAGDADVGLDTAPPETHACCSAIVSYLDHQTDAFGANYVRVENVIGECCETITPRPDDGACTPWGPPSPPAMPSALQEVA